MEKLSLNGDKVWTKIKDFPNGIKAELLKDLTHLSKTTLYECLNELREKDYIENKNRKWHPKIAEKPSEVELIRENLRKDEINPSWNRLVSLADEKGLNPHPITLLNENLRKAEKASLGFMMVDPGKVTYQIKRNVIRYWLSKLEWKSL
jgi:hypothetical protein